MQEKLPKTRWTPLESLAVPTKHKLHCQCICGAQSRIRVKDLLSDRSKQCRKCADKCMDNAKLMPVEELKRRAYLGHKAKAQMRVKYWEPHDLVAVRKVYAIMNGARARCNNPNNAAYPNYGGRGIQFKFASPTDATKWALDNIGARPDAGYSIDRIDNNRHYEPGNLRWATRVEQARNKRAYKRSANSAIIQRVLNTRSDLTYECVRTWLKSGLTEEDIINRRKYVRTSI